MRLHGRPFSRDNTVNTGIPEGAIRRELMAAEDAVELCAQTLNRTPALMIKEVRSELDRDAIQRLERMIEQQQFGLRVEAGPLDALAIPGATDFQAPIDRINVQIVGHADGFSSRVIDGREGQFAPAVCCSSRCSITDLIVSGAGIEVYHSLNRSPSWTASISSSQCRSSSGTK